MSRAFVRDSDADPGPLPDRPISQHPNFVTRRGLAAIEAREREVGRARGLGPGALCVTLRLPSGGSQAFRLVGEDEADASSGLISWMAPLAQALLGRAAGATSTFREAKRRS